VEDIDHTNCLPVEDVDHTNCLPVEDVDHTNCLLVEDVDHTNSRSTANTKRKQRIKVKQMSKQTPQRALIVAINWLLKHPLGDFRNELQ